MDTATLQCGGECARIVGILRVKKAYLEETYHIRSIGLFGSCRRGEEHEGSDVDILVEFSEVPGIFGFLRLEDYLSEILGRKWTWSKRAHSNPASAAVSGKRFCIYDPHGGVPSIMGTISLTEDRDLHRGYAV